MAFAGKVVLITGASSGIGASTAVHFAKLGATLSLTGRKADNLNKVAEESKKHVGGSKVFTVVGDLAKDDDVRNILESTIKHYGRLDVLVNNAGFAIRGTLETSTVEHFDALFNTNVRAVYLLTSLAVPHLIKTKGNIVNISSIVALVVPPIPPGSLIYSMTKATLDQFTKCVALELAPKGVRVNSINPGLIISEFQKRAGLSEEQYKTFVKETAANYPGGRVGDPEEVAKAIAFFASDDASFTTGAVFSVDGGKNLQCPR